ncbi:MAG TPA: RpiB/LacA/LacB family sugar-phosphate isomerase [Acidimicrobiales bacterium]|nr:RpiB/LacA/LacB family sugar-phosphate isomerase [Acidimicrobiales bacterium]
MRIAVGSDEEAPLAAAVVRHLSGGGHDVEVVAMAAPWPEVGRAVGRQVAAGQADLGVVCCWTGTGVSIAANKVKGVRAALCPDAETAAGARRWNDANVVALSIRSTSETVAAEILDAFLSGTSDPQEAANIAGLE